MSNFPWTVEIPIPLIAAIVLGLVYFLRVSRVRAVIVARRLLLESRRELGRALSIINELEGVTRATCKNLGEYKANLSKFKERVGRLSKTQQDGSRHELCHEVDVVLNLTLRLAGQVSDASANICHQSTRLMTFTEARIDPLTGVNNRAGLDHALRAQLAEKARYGTDFSVALLDIDGFKRINDRQGHLEGDQILQEVAKLLDSTVREVDVLARYGGDEFIMVMPKTDLEDAGVAGERTRAKIEQLLPVTISAGVASAVDGDTPESLLSRADAAMYSAKRTGRNCVFCHNGQTIEAVVENADLSGGNLEAATSCEAQPSDIAGTVNQATEAVESECPQAVVAEPAGLLGQVAK